MTIIDFMKEKLTAYPKISEFLAGNDIHIDFTEPDPVNYGLSSTGDSLIKENIRGGQTRQHNFVMYAVGQSYTDYNRLANSNFLLELAYWLERLPEEDGITVNIGDQEVPARFLKATTANAMSMGLMGDTIDKGVMYQIQIYARYFVESEEF
ncbi:hypothetical protein [Lacrimispora sp. 210928-DFI.3.58]|mgnify:CR=1 FL=1|uniref:hypothetical protein n=1 Tax=Lacrimispora sp. 210928-DFI.3.58 TaxID=2883214 RepID=UPI0015B7166D|nr:hypothetical protein [Lacrimispora sp. 210928-DFI.3.58]MCB7321102.1 hypothetical protein [Lacrimispora sp. 210928-DFI.3.58]